MTSFHLKVSMTLLLKRDFKKVADLKDVTTLNAIGEYDGKVYSGKQQTEVANMTKFYRIEDEYIIFNCPPIIEIR